MISLRFTAQSLWLLDHYDLLRTCNKPSRHWSLLRGSEDIQKNNGAGFWGLGSTDLSALFLLATDSCYKFSDGVENMI